MSRKHYQAIARVIGAQRASIKSRMDLAGPELTNNKLSVNYELTIKLMDAFREDNPNFDQVKFVEAVQQAEAATLEQLGRPQ